MTSTNIIKNTKRLAKLLDSQFSIFGFKFGLEPVVGLIPGIGDIVALIFSLSILAVGIYMKLPFRALVRIAINILFDFLIGIMPIAGDVADTIFKANLKNIEILERFAKQK